MSESALPRVAIDRPLLAHGAIMTLLGLLSGFTPIFAKAAIAALEAHTIGVVRALCYSASRRSGPRSGPGG